MFDPPTTTELVYSIGSAGFFVNEPTLPFGPRINFRNGIFYAADEGDFFTCVGWAWYGCLGQHINPSAPVSGSIKCENAPFPDPFPTEMNSVKKECYCQSSDTTTCYVVSWGLTGDADVSLVGGSDPSTSYLSILTDHGYSKTYSMDAFFTLGSQTTHNVKVIVCTDETNLLDPTLVPVVYSYLGITTPGGQYQIL